VEDITLSFRRFVERGGGRKALCGGKELRQIRGMTASTYKRNAYPRSSALQLAPLFSRFPSRFPVVIAGGASGSSTLGHFSHVAPGCLFFNDVCSCRPSHPTSRLLVSPNYRWALPFFVLPRVPPPTSQDTSTGQLALM